MTLKKDVVLLNIEDDIKKNILKMKKAKYSRYPVYKDNENNIIGIINVKDLVLQHKGLDKINLKFFQSILLYKKPTDCAIGRF